jgi:hypothetical protein
MYKAMTVSTVPGCHEIALEAGTKDRQKKKQVKYGEPLTNLPDLVNKQAPTLNLE